jgi:beta-lactamase class A
MVSFLTLTLVVASLAPIRFVPSKALDAKVEEVVDKLAKDLNEPNLPVEVGVAAATVDRANRLLEFGAHRAEDPMYPASVVKMFYMVYLYRLAADGKLTITDEIRRALTDMIVDSNNDATGLIIDEVTGTTGGPELPPAELAAWMKKRQAINEYFKSLGYNGVNACQKTWNEGPYGREKQGYGPNNELRNSLNPMVCLRLISEISLDAVVGPKECESMRALLARKVGVKSQGEDDQAAEFAGRYLPAGSLLWSKAGWMSTERHDVAFIRTPNGKEFALAIFTRQHSGEDKLIGEIAKRLLISFGGLGVQ